MKQYEIMSGMALDLPPGPLLDLDVALRRALSELEACAAARRAHADRVRSRWWGGRRLAFDAAAADLDASVRRAVGDLRTLRTLTAGAAMAER
jgi:hypothetical protein